MGCAASKNDKKENVQACKDRKRLMKQLIRFRGEFAEAQLAYLRSLKNTGVTLRQFTESDSLDLENTTYGLTLPPSPPPPLPPSPPPPPPFSPDLRKYDNTLKDDVFEQESIEIDDDDDICSTPPPPPISNSTWDFLDPFVPSEPQNVEKSEPIEQGEEDIWADTNTEFEEDVQEEDLVVPKAVSNPLLEKLQDLELGDDEFSIKSWPTKDTADKAVVLWRGDKTLTGIVKELDEYFLKASAGGKEIAVFMDIKRGDTLLPQSFENNKENSCNSSKVFSALSWSWSSRSLQIPKDVVESCDLSEPCRPGAHCITLERLYAREQKLYKELKDKEDIEIEHERKSILLQKLQEQDHDWAKTDKTQMRVESLQYELSCLEQSISRTCSSILKLIDEELHPQLVTLTSGLMHMWRTMYECHQIQSHISQQINHLPTTLTIEPTTDYHRQAATQLQNEVTSWYNIFCKLMKSQRDYVRTLCRWVNLASCLVDDDHQSHYLSLVQAFCEEWQLALDRLPDKVAAEAIKSFCSAIHTVILQQEEEHNQQKKHAKLEKKLQRNLNSLSDMEKKYATIFTDGDSHSSNSKHPLLAKRAKTEALRKRVEVENTKYLTSVQVSKAMILNNLKTCLPNVFEALMEFSSSYSHAFEAILNGVKTEDSCD